jgi:hypothetical protein
LLSTLEDSARRRLVGPTTLYELAGRGDLQTVTIFGDAGACR